MIPSFAGVSLWSEDLNNLLPFYRDIIGLKVGLDSPGFVILGDPNSPSLALGTHSEVKGKNNDPARHIVSFMTDDIQGEFQRLESLGAEFIEEPNSDGSFIIATLKDPEGNLVQLLQIVQ